MMTLNKTHRRPDSPHGLPAADVLAALGNTVTVPFDTGYEVWVYHLEPGTAEFVLLFDPAGLLARTRVRTAPLP